MQYTGLQGKSPESLFARNGMIIVLIISIIGASCNLCAEEAKNSVSTSTTINNTVTINLVVSQEVITSLSVVLQNIQNSIKNYYHAATDAAATPLQALYATLFWMRTHKFSTALSASSALWLYLHYSLAMLKYTLQQKSHWSLWHAHLSTDELLALPIAQLGETLGREAFMRYTQAAHPTDIVGPITAFINAVEEEKKLLTTYRDTCTLIEHWGFKKIMWVDTEFAEQCAQRLTRLLYLKTAFTHWITDYTLNNPVLMHAH